MPFKIQSDLESLKQDIQDCFGSNVVYARDCERLAKAISESTNRNISSATLRRFFDLLKTKSEPSKYTLDTLGIYVRKTQAEQGNGVGESPKKIQAKCQELIEENGGLNESLVNHLFSAGYVSDAFHNYSEYLIKMAVRENSPEFWIAYYKQNGLFLDNGLIYHCLGRTLKEHPEFAEKFLPDFAKIKNARLYFFERFVDFGEYDSYYKKWLLIYRNEEDDPIKLLWVESLIIWGEQLADRILDWNYFDQSLTMLQNEIKDAHPYIRARVFGAGLINENWSEHCRNEILGELINERNDLEIDPAHGISFLVFQYLLYTDSKDLIRKVKNNMSTYIKSEKANILDSRIPFVLKLIDGFLNNSSNLKVAEIETYQTKFTNEDELMKRMALNYTVKESI